MNYFIIPARSGSKGVPNKNVILLNGIHLLGYSIKTASASRHTNQIILSTDSDEYIEIAKIYGNVISIKRNKLTSNDKAKDIDYMLHTIFQLELDEFDNLIILRPTSPIRKIEVVDKAIEIFNTISYDFDALRSMHVLPEAPEKMFRLNSDNSVKPLFGDDIDITNQPRQMFEESYHPNGYVDIVSVRSIMQTKKSFGNKIYGYITERIYEIDTVEDIDFLNIKMKGI
ncbi:MAG: acylneuraminate cytidylyltransferase family protein [Candidatus Nanoarchaeia archaeon]|jgi:CMP-N-acetylneuraminic acid synthetase|nr:acylneuraminate cytidylyltransferase family protein [Candidatus Nanoarchaeia archaeon]